MASGKSKNREMLFYGNIWTIKGKVYFSLKITELIHSVGAPNLRDSTIFGNFENFPALQHS